MAITKKPTNPAQYATAAAADAFIAAAPDAAAASPGAPRRVRKGRKVQITLTITEPLLDRVDELASQIGQSRAAVINLAVMQMLQSGLRINET
jgi:hypothetical protein